MFLYAIVASVISIVLTLAITQISAGLTMLSIIFASWFTGFTLLYGFTKAENRVPEPKEFEHFYIVYVSMYALAFFVL